MRRSESSTFEPSGVAVRNLPESGILVVLVPPSRRRAGHSARQTRRCGCRRLRWRGRRRRCRLIQESASSPSRWSHWRQRRCSGQNADQVKLAVRPFVDIGFIERDFCHSDRRCSNAFDRVGQRVVGLEDHVAEGGARAGSRVGATVGDAEAVFATAARRAVGRCFGDQGLKRTACLPEIEVGIVGRGIGRKGWFNLVEDAAGEVF